MGPAWLKRPTKGYTRTVVDKKEGPSADFCMWRRVQRLGGQPKNSHGKGGKVAVFAGGPLGDRNRMGPCSAPPSRPNIVLVTYYVYGDGTIAATDGKKAGRRSAIPKPIDPKKSRWPSIGAKTFLAKMGIDWHDEAGSI